MTAIRHPNSAIRPIAQLDRALHILNVHWVQLESLDESVNRMMSTMQGAVTSVASSTTATTSVVARSNVHGIISAGSARLQASAAKELSAKHSSLYARGGMESGVWKRSKSLDTRAATGTVKAVLGDILGGIFTAKKKDTVVLNGSLLLSKKSILDLVNVGADLIDVGFDVLDLDITLQLVGVDLDPGKSSFIQFATKAWNFHSIILSSKRPDGPNRLLVWLAVRTFDRATNYVLIN